MRLGAQPFTIAEDDNENFTVNKSDDGELTFSEGEMTEESARGHRHPTSVAVSGLAIGRRASQKPKSLL